VNTGPELIRPAQARERNWMPIGIAAGLVLIVVAVIIFVTSRSHNSFAVAPVTAAVDPYSANLPISNLAMSESSNLAGGKVTYIDGHIANKGSQTISGISVQVLFRDFAHEVAQNDPPQSVMLIRTREPYIDTQPVSAAPLKPGDERDFRLSFDTITPSWDGAYPEIRILRVQTQ
jgi:Protein of unknown function (DUF2393)